MKTLLHPPPAAAPPNTKDSNENDHPNIEENEIHIIDPTAVFSVMLRF